MHVGGSGVTAWIMFFVALAVVVNFGLGLRLSAIEIAACITVPSVLILALLLYGDEGTHLTGIWRFGPGRISRQMRLPLPKWIWPREFSEGIEFEIVHTLWTKAIFSRRLHGGHQDTLRFRARGESKPVSVMIRVRQESSATLRGSLFTQHQASEIEREILPDVMAIAALASQAVGAPLYVIEKTFYVGSDIDG